ncbi:xcbC [Neisseria sp. N95_16]|uniref:Phosphodiester glycosidase family protein n=1 Tax=Neisseria brasiliensis TaxID=2666100 RepID=A0A7X2GYH3_9NEIS|nr:MULTISPECIES: phosphodiester glycosidase family protein [Neisseria]MRN38293.1 phosphodiester glycosidase family protein [Neisseria brasiliensis]PJO09790.1 xcbC [Neisseria sp. N95_16]
MKKFFSILSIFILSFFNSEYTYAQSLCIQQSSQNHIHIAKINLNCKGINLIATQEADKGMTVSQFARKYRTDIAINGSFFRTGYFPFGLAITDHKTWDKTRDVQKRVFLACNRQNRCIIEDKNMVSKVDDSWKLAVSGWQAFNPATKKFECSDDDPVGCTHIKFITKQPRTMVGLDEKRNYLYFIVIDGRLPKFKGATLNELGQLASSLKLTKAINLDGGGSSTMVKGYNRISTLPATQKKERVVANHLGVEYVSP